jgi:hypothetical protein
MTTELISLRDLQDEQPDDTLYPAVTQQQQCRLAPGETVLWSSIATVGCLHSDGGILRQTWELEACHILVTDQRLAYLCPKFTKGSTAWGFGPVGIAAALVITSASHLRAANRRRGRVAAGQIRFQWPTQVTVESRTAVIGVVDKYLTLRCERAGAGPLHLRLWSGKYDAAVLAPFLVSRIAQFRLTFPYRQPLTDAQRTALGHQAVRPVSRDVPAGDARRQLLVYDLPGGREIPQLGD